MIKKIFLASAIAFFAVTGSFADKTPWGEVSAPSITKV